MNYFKKRKQLQQEIKENAFTENGKPNYAYYVISKNEKFFYTIVGMIIFALIGFTFYHSFIIAAVVSLIGLFFPDYMYKVLLERRKKNLNMQFKDLLYSVSSSLSAGKSVERAFIEAPEDLKMLYPDEETDILKELGYIINGLSVNETIESLLADFAARSEDEDVQSFADVFVSCKRTGGNLIEVVRITSNIISDKIEIKREIAAGLSEKKFEQKGMCALMILMILGLTYMSGDYMDVMFTMAKGRIAMTIALLMLIASYFIGEKIMNIKV
jgi:tight adherence protein B